MSDQVFSAPVHTALIMAAGTGGHINGRHQGVIRWGLGSAAVYAQQFATLGRIRQWWFAY